MSSRLLLLLVLSLFSLTLCDVTPIEFYQDTPKYFPLNTFDTVNSASFRDQAYGSYTYSIATWFKTTRTSVSNDAILFHLTALDVEYPWDGVQYTAGIRHLANLIRVRMESNRYMRVDVGTFNNYQNNDYNYYAITHDCWHYVYIGVNHLTGKFTNGLFSQGCQSGLRFQEFTFSDTPPYTNEALDNRLTLYLGGSKNHITTVNSQTEAWPGVLYRTMFLIGFYTNNVDVARILMGGERKNMYFFFMDNTVTQQVIPSSQDPNSLMTLGSTTATELADATLKGIEGLTFRYTNNQQMFLTLSKELSAYNFISLWVYIEDTTPTSAYHSIMSIRTASGAEFLSLMLEKSTRNLFIRRGASTVANTYTAALKTWHFVFISFNYLFGDSSNSILVSFTVNSNPIYTSQRLTDYSFNLPADLVQPLSVIYFGKITGVSDNNFNGAIRNVIGGAGTYYVQDTSANANCVLSIGLKTPYCLYCNPAKSLYADPSGACVSACPVGTYLDTRTITCVPCDITCSACSGPGPEACTACAEDTPLYFRSMCFDNCPPGTLKNSKSECDCDPSCSGCKYVAASKATECVGCAINTLSLLPNKMRCVPPTECPINTIAVSTADILYCADPSTCAVGTFADHVSKKCLALCPDPTVKYNSQCYAKCPDGTFKKTAASSLPGETTFECGLCTSPCQTCGTSATDCLTCTGANLFHEDLNLCDTTCHAGFEFKATGYFCKACRKGCTSCSPNLVLLRGATTADNLCIDSCPLGMTSSAGECVASTTVDTTILNKTVSVPTIMISRKQNLVLVGDYASPSTITSVEWSLTTPDSQFFTGVVTNQKNLVIPAANLKADTTYQVNFKVSDSRPSTDTESVTVRTSPAIAAGTFEVTPDIGTAFQTEFTMKIDGFSNSQNLKYDIVSYFERSHTINGQTFKERVETISIALGVDQGTYTFIFPISQVQKPYTIEVCAYNQYEQTCLTKTITLKPSGDLPLQQVLVWSADATTLKTLDRMLDFVKSISLFYSREWDNQISTEYARGALLIDNLAVTKNLVACNKVAECSNAGACAISGSSFTCSCELGFGGFSCFYGERQFATVSIRIRDILTNLYSIPLDITNVEKAIVILEELTNTLDMIEYNSIFFFKDIMANVLKVPGLKKQHFRPIFNVLAEVIGFVKRSLTGTWFKPVDRSLLLVSLTGLVDDAFGLLDGIRMPDSYFLVDTNFIKVMVVNNVAGTFLGTTAGSAFSVDWETFGFTLPQELMTKLPTGSVKMLGYKINPYSDSQTNSQITSVMKVEVFGVNGPYPVTGLTTPINLRIPKLAATPVFAASTLEGAYNCQYKSTTVRSKINFLTTGCSFVSESTTHVSCDCTHLTEFVGQLDLTKVASVPSSASISAVNNDYIAQVIAFETSKRAYYVTPVTPTVETVTVEVKIIREITLLTIGLYIAGAIIILYLLFMLFNIGNTKKNALKKFLDQGQSILVLTYHPILSMFIKAHTTTSNTQLMRVTKFFCMVESYAGLTSIFFLALDFELSMTGGSKLVLSSIITLILAPWWCYFVEYLYGKMKKRAGKRRSTLYHYTHLVMMAFWAAVTILLVGLIRSEYRYTWMGSWILTTVLDVVVFDLTILVFAMMQKNNSKYLKLFKLKGFYVDTGAASIYTPEDEAALIAKMKKILRADTLRDINSDASPVFGNVNRIAGELEDLNASHVTDINAEDLKDKNEEQPDQLDSVLPPLEEEDDQKDHEIPQLVQGIAKASVRQPVMRNLSYKPKMPTDKTRKPPVTSSRTKQ